MSIRNLCLAGAAAFALTTPAITPAQAGEGWYLGLGAGWDSLTSTHITGAGLDGKVHGRDTALFDASAGYKFGNFRIEAETGWDRHHLDDFTSGGLSDPLENGHLEMRSLMVNGVYDIPLTSRFRLSLGAGAGVGNQRIKFTDPALATTFSNSDRTRFMWQGIGGLSYEVNPQVDLFVDYRYRSNVGNASDVLASTIRSHDVNEQAVIAGFRWYPGAHEERVAYEPPPAPPAPPPPPPAPPAPPPAVKTFIVFFDFNKSNLTPEAVTVVGDAVKEAKTTGAVRVLVTGHTDTVGSDAYNQALSVRRAQSVKDQMVADGMAGDTIAIEGKSFHDPLVATGPGVREPQNRRAVIDLNGNG